jgi:arylsulfatase A-like enzyme
LQSFDTLRKEIDRGDQFSGMDRFQMQALDIITSREVRDAFDLRNEPIRNIERYGKGQYTHQTVKHLLYPWEAKKFVLARRLVEAGVRVVTLSVGSWDHHSGPDQHIFESYRHVLPVLDQSIHALVTDLEDRGLRDDVLVVVLGEFGRTPKLTYPGPGREHWADAGCVLLYGGGLRMGQVIGETDSKATQAKNGETNFQNLIATVYHVLGIDPRTTLTDFSGRPQTLLDDPKPIAELV